MTCIWGYWTSLSCALLKCMGNNACHRAVFNRMKIENNSDCCQPKNLRSESAQSMRRKTVKDTCIQVKYLIVSTFFPVYTDVTKMAFALTKI